MRLLIIEDAARLRESLSLGLRNEKYEVDAAGDGEQGLWLASNHEYNAIILDLMLPKLSGLAVLEKLRDSGKHTPVLILTAKDSVNDRVTGLRTGADDYLVKPFAFEELLARIEALIRRQYGAIHSVLAVGAVRIDLLARHAQVHGKPIELTAREYATLEYLATRKGQIVTRSEIEASVYRDSVEIMSNVVDTIIYSLRRKLDGADAHASIHTVRGMGYELQEEGV